MVNLLRFTTITPRSLHSTLPSACASAHLSVQAIYGAFESASVDMSNNAWAIVFADHLARCGGDAYVNTAHSWLLVTVPIENISEDRGARGVGVEVRTL
jgi:hypothetical protein